MIHIEPITFVCRKFDDDKSFGDEYEGVMVIQKLGKTGYCAGAHGTVSMKDFRALEVELKQYGIEKLKWSRGKEFK